jgi:hypothetical protein
MLVLEVYIIGILILWLVLHFRKNKDLLRLWTAYDIAKLSGDKEKAFEAGRAFFKRKKGKVTVYDEQVIANDLSTVK